MRFLTVTKGAAKSLGNSWRASKAAWVSALIAAGGALFTAFVVLPILRWRSNKRHAEIEEAAAAAAKGKE